MISIKNYAKVTIICETAKFYKEIWTEIHPLAIILQDGRGKEESRFFDSSNSPLGNFWGNPLFGLRRTKGSTSCPNLRHCLRKPSAGRWRTFADSLTSPRLFSKSPIEVLWIPIRARVNPQSRKCKSPIEKLLRSVFEAFSLHFVCLKSPHFVFLHYLCANI